MLPEEPLHEIQARADAAAASVTAAYARPLLRLPGTTLASVDNPRPRRVLPGPWHYWWQAHYVDALVDAALRGAPGAARQAHVLVRTIRLRNGLRATNWYFDDMAWLALAVHRLDTLVPVRPERNQDDDGGAAAAHGRQHPRMLAALGDALRSAHTLDFGGGLYWNRRRTFKNTPATAPAALHFARSGERERAQSLIDWLNTVLIDPGTGLYLDGVKAADGSSGETAVERAVYTYNQGPVLGALLELGGPANLSRAAELVGAISNELSHAGTAVLITHGTGDAGLFTGILCRYLALAALSPTLPEDRREQAAELVTATAQALWAGRTKRGQRTVFSPHPLEPADRHYPAGTGVGLSTQLSAWMILEAAARVRRGLS
ncbi:glycoside hydrolase family 76 protein [Arthrobacter sp. zg-Y1219]|uniref:glycoside hydrolase family 76 protein n=1 Tax=Arthrobacter sp. zg-Y1219 TaxID=3049067 RepID=UPI0024C42DAD|nr:glycoside hydrolase family 76 protein [Arthrobacter sp. zg-Y1219]MDK1361508.1 glycoside hydrolase family 76 protein [Arthrobacter sp. zg-Y1219]